MFHVYRVVCKSGKMTLDIDGAAAFATDKMDKRSERIPWTPVTASIYALAFGNEQSVRIPTIPPSCSEGRRPVFPKESAL